MLAPAVSAIFTQSLQTGVVPTDWTKAYVSLVFKKCSRHLPENYRPISLTSICCKVMEYMIVKHINNHNDQYDSLTQYQHGFCQARSGETQLLTNLHNIMHRWTLTFSWTWPYWTLERLLIQSRITVSWASYSTTVYTVSQKKRSHYYFLNNSVKNEPILIIFWQTESWRKLTLEGCKFAHLTHIL